MNICVIPARGGSKRIPRKNIKPFFGRPVISYAIELAFESTLFDRILVTTEDEEIGELAIDYGAEWHHRSPENANDIAIDFQVIQEVLKTVNADYLCYLYPVTPLLEKRHLKRGFDMVLSGLWDVVWATGTNGEEAGAFYWLACKADVSKERYYHDWVPIELDQFSYHDVNTPEDWRVMAEKYAAKLAWCDEYA